MSKTSIRKRHRQQVQQERQQEKAARRDQRRLGKPVLSRPTAQQDPDLKGMVPGPQRLAMRGTTECAACTLPAALKRLALYLPTCYHEPSHRGGPRMKHLIVRPITDVVVAENLIGSLT
jgi:hypothetical protein